MTLQISDFSAATRDWLASGRYEQVGLHQMFFHEWGPAAAEASDKARESDNTGAAILLLHGFPTSSYDWRGVAARLSARFRVIAPDFLGYGLSDKPAAYSYSLFQQADTIEELLSRLGVKAAHLVSHDVGTSVHCELLARQATQTPHCVIKTSTFLNGSMLQWLAEITPFQQQLSANATLPQAIELCRTALVAMYVPGLKMLMRRPEAIAPDDELVMRELLQYQDGQLRLPALAGYMRERYIHADRWLGALETLGTPLQFVWADSDPIAHLPMGQELARRCPQADFHPLPGLGHFLLLEDPAAVAAKIAEFVGR